MFAVVAVIAATLFPLWPAEMRVGVYYLSVAAGCFVAGILLLAVGMSSRLLYLVLYQYFTLQSNDTAFSVFSHLISGFPFCSARCILFLIIWVVTAGRHHFWFLPNLTADVGFVDSFRPLYTHEYKGPRSSSKKSSSEKSDNKDSSKAQKSDSEDKSDSEKKDGDEEEDEDDNKEMEASEEAGAEHQSDTDSDRREDEGSQHSNGNDFEMITREELEQHTEEEEEEDEEEQSETKPLTVQT